MTHWWSLARGEWILLAVMAGAGIGVGVASALGLDQLAVWVVCFAGALLLGGLTWFVGRGRDSQLPAVGLGTGCLVSVPVLAVWWIVLAPLLGVPFSGPSAAYFVWFVAGILLARIIARLLTAFLGRNGTAA